MLVSNQDNLLSLIHRNPLAHDITAFLVDLQARGYSSRTLQFYRDELGHLRAYLEEHGIRDVLRITPAHLRSYLVKLGEPRNAGGVHCAYRATKTFLRWYDAEYEPDGWKNPITKVKAPALRKEPLHPLPLPDLKAMIATCKTKTLTGDRDRALMLTLLDTGCRASEFLALRLSDLDLSSGAIMVKRGKGNKSRGVFVGTKTRCSILRYLRHRPDAGENASLFATDEGGRLSITGLQSIMRRRATRAIVPTPSLHSFRRNCSDFRYKREVAHRVHTTCAQRRMQPFRFRVVMVYLEA